ncbi:MAG TPA: hypothetical protein VK594_12395, partial [Streptosporangiaceae bacterium]|nr:hypothetical protein [Streptosporangiaceae bacterium]
PPLELPTARPRRFGRGARSPHSWWSTWTPRLAPLAAALAVIAIVITTVTLSPPPHQGGPDLVTGTAARPDVPLGPPVSTYVRSGQVPPYFVTITPSGAAVHLTVGGAAVATIRPSLPGGKVVAVTAAGDDRTFVLAEQGQDRKAVTFYQFRLGSSGRPGGLTRLPMSVPDEKRMTGLALSPDGTRLAIAVAPGGGVQQVRLYPIHGGAGRTWSATGGTLGEHFSSWSLSWPASQRTLAFNWSAGQTTSVRLLNLGTAGGSLLAASRPAVTLAKTAELGQTQYQCQVMTITPDGSAIVCPSSTITDIAKNGTMTYSTGFPEFSVTTGRLIRITGHWPRKQNDPFVYTMFWSGASGQVLIGMIHSAGRDWVGVISGNRFTPLNVPSSLGTYAFGTW